MKILKLNSRGPDVVRWQNFLRGLDYKLLCDGDFNADTDKATRAFQKARGLVADGVVGNVTMQKAVAEGLPLFNVESSDSDQSLLWPLAPTFKPMSPAQRLKIFGSFEYAAAPTKGNPEAIEIDKDWVKQNIVTVQLPVFGKRRFHRLAAPRVVALFERWENAGLLDYIDTFNGSFVPRFKRGSTESLSNHSWGSAFDINAMTNPLGAIPPSLGASGSVRNLVPIANEMGFYWGGHFGSRPDGMHFEIAFLP